MYTNYYMAIVFFIWAIVLNLIAGSLVSRPQKLFLFPFFECFMTVSYILLWQTSVHFAAYFILISALGITLSTDLSCMLISRFVSLYLAPTGLLLSYYGLLPISWQESMIAGIAGYFFFYLINTIFFLLRKQDGLGQGDFDLMALIGAYTGLLGIWFTILFGSILGTLSTLIFIISQRKTIRHMPFGPFLSIAAILWILFQNQIISKIC